MLIAYRQIKGSSLRGSEEVVGHIEDLVIDDQQWAIRYVAVDTKNWLPARKVLVSPQWIESISWHDATVSVNLTRESVKGAPEYDPIQPVNRAYEQHLYDYYGRERYWLPSTEWNQPTGVATRHSRSARLRPKQQQQHTSDHGCTKGDDDSGQQFPAS